MSNNWFFDFVRFKKGTKAKAEAVNSVFDQLVVGMDKMPTEANMNQGTHNYAVDSGSTVNQYVVTIAHISGSYQNAQRVTVLTARANTGPITLNASGIGNTAVTLNDGSAVPSGLILENSMFTAEFNATRGNWQILGYFNITSTVTAFIATLLDDATAAAARATLGALSKVSDDTTIGNITTSNTAPKYTLIETGVTADYARWDVFVNSQQINYRILSDNGSTTNNYLTVSRAAAVVSTTTLLGDIVDLVAATVKINNVDVPAAPAVFGVVEANAMVSAASDGDVDFPSGTTLKIQNTELLNLIYPVGAIYTSTVNASPSSILGGTWTSIRTGRVLISESGSYAAGNTFGDNDGVAHNHPDTFSIDNNTDFTLVSGGAVPVQQASHNHPISGSVSNNTPGTNDNMQESLAVYMWERTA